MNNGVATGKITLYTQKMWTSATSHLRPIMHPDSLYPLFPIFSFLSFILVLVPFPWHLQAWNSGTCFYMMWTALACLNQFINSVVWANDAINRAPVFCDICEYHFTSVSIVVLMSSVATRITIAASFGIPASALCIVRRLYIIASVRSASVSVSKVSLDYPKAIPY